MPPDNDDEIGAARLATAGAWIAMREMREREFAAELLGDPVWSMLLDLYVHYRSGVSVWVSSLCVAARVPMTTALRWIDTLERDGLVRREDDPHDRRRLLVRLTPIAIARMERTLDRVHDLYNSTAR